MTDLVVLSLEPWDDVWRRNQHLLSGLLRADPHLRLLFVEPAADPLHDAWSRRRPEFGRALSARDDIAPGRAWTYRPAKWLPRRIDPNVDDRLAKSVRAAASSAGMSAPILWLNDPGAVRLSASTGWPTLYDITDDWLSADRPSAERHRVEAAERYLLEHSAEVVACSAELIRRKSPLRPAARHPISFIPNAVDVGAYRMPRSRPGDLPAGPVALYAGTIHPDRFDVELTVGTAQAVRGRGSIVLVGPTLLSPGDAKQLNEAGVIVLGSRPRDDLIAYLQHADVLIVPHVVTAFTDSLDPIKLYEYQAVGRPVVSTPVSGFRDADDDAITIAADGEFVQAVRAGLSHSRRTAQNRSVADWGVRVTAMREVLERMST